MYIIPCDFKKVDFRETNLPEQNIFNVWYCMFPKIYSVGKVKLQTSIFKNF